MQLTVYFLLIIQGVFYLTITKCLSPFINRAIYCLLGRVENIPFSLCGCAEVGKCNYVGGLGTSSVIK